MFKSSPLSRHFLHWAMSLVAVICLWNTPSASTGEGTLDQTVTNLASPYLDAEKTVGLSLGIIKDSQRTAIHLGKTNAEGSAPDGDTIYEIGSITKVMTGILLADAVVRGEVTLDQSMQELLPERVTMPTHEGKGITLLNLATHTSGLPRLANNMPGRLTQLWTNQPYANYNAKLALEFLHGYKLRRAPGEKYEYSNYAASLLGYLVAEKQGLTYEQLLRQRLAEPLRMQSTWINVPEKERKRQVAPHRDVRHPVEAWDFADLPAAGGVRSTLTDMMRFAEAQLDPPTGELGKALQLAWKEHRPRHDDDSAMGLGWHIAHDGHTRWHNGQTGGSHSMLLVNRQNRTAVVLLANTASMELDRLALDIMRLLAGEKVEPRHFD